MAIYFDHLVHFINAAPREVVESMKEHGWHAVPGGRHEKWGSYNSLLYAGLSYIEFLAVENAEIAEESTNPLIQLLTKDQQGFGQICLRTDDIERWKEDLSKKEIATGPVIHAERMRENGDLLKWKMLFIEESGEGLPYPFFIEWGQDDCERLGNMKQLGIIPETQADRKISAVHFGVENIESRAADWSRLLNIKAGETYLDSTLGTSCKSIQVAGTELVFTEPGDNDYIRGLIAKRGERPLMASFDGCETKSAVELYGGLYRL